MEDFPIKQEYPNFNYADPNYHGSAFEFGYIAVGRFVLNCCRWIYQQIQDNSISHFLFLSRDGKVFYEAFVLLYPELKDSVSYIYISRKVIRMVSISSTSCLLKEISKFNALEQYTLDELYSYFCNAELNESHLKWLGENSELSSQQRIKCKQYQQVFNFFNFFSDEVVDHCKQVRQLYLDYLVPFLAVNDRLGVFDVGYEGTAQSFLINVTAKPIYGFYLGTFKQILKNVSDQSLVHSYLFHLGDRADNLYGFTQQVALLESLFSAEDGSFIGYDLISKQPLFFEENGNKRQGFVNQLHCGVLKYCEDAIDVLPRQKLTASQSFFLIYYFFNYPIYKQDIKIFDKINFYYDSISNNYKCIIDSQNTLSDVAWQLGQTRIRHSDVFFIAQIQRQLLKLENTVFKKVIKGKYRKKYEKSRTAFYIDSQKKFVKIYFNLFGKRF